MLVCHTIFEVQEALQQFRAKDNKIALVPTMGFLHPGHLSLMRQAKEMCPVVVASIFVNPTQFGPGEDFGSYPRNLNQDVELAESAGVDVIFAPAVEEMYPAGYSSFVEVLGVSAPLCGAARPGHFRGVATVVTKLFNIIRPDMAFFGQKDAQQVLVLKKMVQDLNMHVQIKVGVIVREADGVALSSRNTYLTPEQRQAAPVLYRSLQTAEAAVARGERNIAKIRAMVAEMIASEPLANVDYIEILSIPELNPIQELTGSALLALAVRFGRTRLIDNIVLEA